MSEALSPSREADIAEVSGLIQTLWPYGSDKNRVNEAYKELKKFKFTPNRVFELFCGKAKRVDGFEKDLLRTLAAERAREVHEANNELSELRARLSRLEAALAVADADFHGPQIEAARGALGRPRGVVDAGSNGGSIACPSNQSSSCGPLRKA